MLLRIDLTMLVKHSLDLNFRFVCYVQLLAFVVNDAIKSQ